MAADDIAFCLRLAHLTALLKVRSVEHPSAFWNGRRPVVSACWHGRLLMIPAAWTTDRPMHVLISQHRDGELIARAMDRFGLHTVRGSGAKAGSAEKGGRAALRRSEEHTSELQSLMRISYAVFCLKKKNNSYNSLITWVYYNLLIYSK